MPIVPPKRVLVTTQYEIEFGRGVSRGVIAYARQNTNWRLWRQRHVTASDILSTKTDGVITQWLAPHEYPPLRDAGIAIVLLGAIDMHPALSAVGVDENATATLAAEHFTDLGLRQFAFVGSGYWPFVHRRLAGFNGALAIKGLGPARTFIEPMYEEQKRLQFERELEKWLAELPRPCGVLAANDAVGVEVVAAARRTGIRVPDDIAVVGVDDDELACELSDVPLSSVAQPVFAIGYEAGRLLDRQMQNPDEPMRNISLPPVTVSARASSDIVAIDDDDVAHALRLIRDHAADGIDVAWVVSHMPVSRRSLERRFREATGRSMLEQIQRMRFRKARELLAETDLSLKTIARQSGFRDGRWLTKSFMRHLHVTPTGFRKQFRSPGDKGRLGPGHLYQEP